jgi:hypothetical protein
VPEFVDRIQAELPLLITAAEVDANGVSLGGDTWRLRVNANWRVLHEDGGTAPPANSDGGAGRQELDGLIGNEFIEVGLRPHRFGLDLALTTREGKIFEIFSDFYYGEWLLSFWPVGDEQQLPIFELEGPVAPGQT